MAAKTGTTNDYRDVWTVGYTPTIAVGVWAGNNDNSPMQKKTAGFIVSPLWHAFMEKALAIRPKEYFGEPTSRVAPSEDQELELPTDERATLRRWEYGSEVYEDGEASTTPTHDTPIDLESETAPPIQYEVDTGIPL